MSKNIQEKLIGVANYINGIKQLIKLVGHNQTIASNLSSLKPIAVDLTNSRKKTPEFNELTRLLSTSTFSPGDPSAFSSQGNILVAYQHMVNEAVRREFTESLNLLGELDTYVALAKKIKIHEKLNNWNI